MELMNLGGVATTSQLISALTPGLPALRKDKGTDEVVVLIVCVCLCV